MNDEISQLRMNSMERFHFHDDSPEYPNNIFAKLYFKGPLDEETARLAFEVTADRHPLTKASVRGKYWAWTDDVSSRILWNRGTSVASQWLNMEFEKSSRMFGNYDADTDETTIVFQVHHAAVDGQAGVQFSRDWMKTYDNICAGKPPREGLTELRNSSYRGRNRLGLFRLSGLKTILMFPIGLYGAFKFSFRNSTPIAPLPQLEDDTLKDDFPAVTSFEITKKQMAGIKSYVNQQQITLNDWLVSCCFRSLMCWRETFGQHRAKDWYRVIVPMSIRSLRDRELPACNRVAIIQLDRRENRIVDKDKLSRSINHEMGVIRKAELQKMFLLVIKFFSAIPFLLKSKAQRQKCQAMTVMTNLGRLFLKTGLERSGNRIKMGEAELIRAEMVPPIRFGTPVTFSAARYGGSLYLTIHVDTRYIRMEDARQLLNDFGHRVASV